MRAMIRVVRKQDRHEGFTKKPNGQPNDPSPLKRLMLSVVHLNPMWQSSATVGLFRPLR
jgi:hypothetical protein